MKLHFCKVEIESQYVYRLLNYSKDIPLTKIKIKEDKTSFEIDFKDVERLKNILDEVNVKILKLAEDGLYVKMMNFPMIKSLSCIFAIFIMLMALNSLFIWNIDIDGNYTYTSSQISSFLRQKNISEGIKKSKLDCNSIEKSIRKKFDDISWVCAEVKGTNLIIHIKENYITEINARESKPYDIIANKDGKITSVLVRQGTPAVKAGDTVKKGDVLIAGAVDVFDEFEQKLFTSFCPSDGEIYAQTKYSYKDFVKINYDRKIIKSRRTLYLPSLFGYKWININKSKNKDVIYSEEYFKIFGNFYLPVSMQKYAIINYRKEPAVRTKEQALKMLNNKLLYKLAVMEQKDYKILRKDVKMYKEKESYVLSGTITCREPLGAVSYIDTTQYQKESEEGTT